MRPFTRAIVLVSLVAACAPGSDSGNDDTGNDDTDTGDTDTGDTDTGDTDTGDTDSGDTDSGVTDTGDTATDSGGSDDSDSGADLPTFILHGGVQKGPFILGSSVQIATLDATGFPTGQVFPTTTTTDRGDFTVVVTAAEGTALDALTTGFAFDEFTGELGGATTTLRALAVSGSAPEQAVYINTLTHLAYPRALSLYRGGADLTDAIAQAEAELLAALPGLVAPEGLSASQLSVLGPDDDGNGYLLAVSCVAAQAAFEAAGSNGSPAAELQQLLNTMASDLEPDGTLTGNAAGRFAAAAAVIDGQTCMDNLAAWRTDLGDPATVPDLFRAVDFDGDGTADSHDDDADGDGVLAADDQIVAVAGTNHVLAMLDSDPSAGGGQVWLVESDATFGPVRAARRLEVSTGEPITGVVLLAGSPSFLSMVDASGVLWRWTPGFDYAWIDAGAPADVVRLRPADDGLGSSGTWAVTAGGDVYRLCQGCNGLAYPLLTDVADMAGNPSTGSIAVLHGSGAVTVSTASLVDQAVGGLDEADVERVAVAGPFAYFLASDGKLYQWDSRAQGAIVASVLPGLSGVSDLESTITRSAYARTSAGWWRLPDASLTEPQWLDLPAEMTTLSASVKYNIIPDQAFVAEDGTVFAESSVNSANARWVRVPR